MGAEHAVEASQTHSAYVGRLVGQRLEELSVPLDFVCDESTDERAQQVPSPHAGPERCQRPRQDEQFGFAVGNRIVEDRDAELFWASLTGGRIRPILIVDGVDGREPSRPIIDEDVARVDPDQPLEQRGNVLMGPRIVDPNAVGCVLDPRLDCGHLVDGVAEKGVGGRRMFDLGEVVDDHSP